MKTTQWPIKHWNNPKLTDARYSITREYNGARKPQWVFRWCDEYHGGFKLYREAVQAAKEWQAAFYKEMTY